MPRIPSHLLFTHLLALGLAAAGPARAAWPHDPYTGNVPVCTAAGDQSPVVAVSDGAGGMICAWTDARSGSSTDIYAQRVSAAGVPLWTVNGVAVAAASGGQTGPVICSDGVGGAIIAWVDARSGVNDIYAQRVNASGTMLWTANGVPVCTATGAQAGVVIAADGSGGALLAWEDSRGANVDLYAQRVGSAGATAWAVGGVAICTATNSQTSPVIVTDAAGGAIIAWEDQRSSSLDVYAQRVLAAGTVSWTANGTLVSGADGFQYNINMVPDGAGGALLAWMDSRNGAGPNIYGQSLTSGGTSRWTSNGHPLCTPSAGTRSSIAAAADGSGGILLAWQDTRNSEQDVYCQRVAPNGYGVWTTDGVLAATGSFTQSLPNVVSDGAGGMVVAWHDYTANQADIRAQRVTALGSATWALTGVNVCSAVGGQLLPVVVPDGASGGIVTWYDSRSGSYDVYCQRIEKLGQLGNPEPAITGVKDVKNDQGGVVKVTWSASWLDVEPTFGIFDYRLWRSVPAASLAGARAVLARGVTADADDAAARGALLAGPTAATADYLWEIVGTQSAGTLAGYSYVAPTTADSVAGSFPRTAFMVEARAGSSVSSDRWFSLPDSGYSVDNLGPATPAPFTGVYGAGTARLAWNPNHESDLAGYRFYRGTSAGFATDGAHLVSAQPDTGYIDPAGAPYWYKLTAVDVHGNESPVATLLPSGTLGVDGAAPAAWFAAPAPNPARGGSVLRYALARPGRVRLEVLDAAGRSVRVLADGESAAGEQSVRWDARDGAGRAVAPGLYFVRATGSGLAATRRLAVIE